MDTPKDNRGGLRSPAGGRPPKEKKKVKINITIDAELVEWIDGQGSNRSDFINKIIATRRGTGEGGME